MTPRRLCLTVPSAHRALWARYASHHWDALIYTPTRLPRPFVPHPEPEYLLQLPRFPHPRHPRTPALLQALRDLPNPPAGLIVPYPSPADLAPDQLPEADTFLRAPAGIPVLMRLHAHRLIDAPRLPKFLKVYGYQLALETTLDPDCHPHLNPDETCALFLQRLVAAAPSLLFLDPVIEGTGGHAYTGFQGASPIPHPSFFQLVLEALPETPVSLTRPSYLQAIRDRLSVVMWDAQRGPSPPPSYLHRAYLPV